MLAQYFLKSTGTNTREAPFHVAAYHGRCRALATMLVVYPKGPSASLNYIDALPLHKAVQGSHLEATQLLLRWYPEAARCKTVYGWTPLHYAAFYGDDVQNDGGLSLRILGVLVEEFPLGLQEKDERGKTPFFEAVLQDNGDTARELLRLWPECVGVPDASGVMPMCFAAEDGNEALVEAMLAVYPEGVMDRDPGGYTPSQLLPGASKYDDLRRKLDDLKRQLESSVPAVDACGGGGGSWMRPPYMAGRL